MLKSFSHRLLQHSNTTPSQPRLTMATRRSSRLTASQSASAAPPITSHFPSSKPATKRTAEKITDATNPVDHLPNGANKPAANLQNPPSIPQPPRKKPTRRPGPVAANTAPRQVKQLAHTTHPLETLSAIPPPPSSRLVDAEKSNAPLLTPGTSTPKLLTRPPVPAALPREESGNEAEDRGDDGLTTPTTTATALQTALAHLISVEPKLKPIIEKHPCAPFSEAGLAEPIDPWVSLTSSIIGQQVSGAAAQSIKAKFIALFHPSISDASQHVFPTPEKVAETSVETLRTAGLSQRKAEYIQGLAGKFACGELRAEWLMNAPFEEVFERLVRVRGLGRWSVEMFACFGLKRFDVFSAGDLGVQRGMAALMGRDVGRAKREGRGKWKYMGEAEMREISERYRPWRSVFMWYMWRLEGVDGAVVEKA